MDPSARHQSAGVVPGGQALIPLLITQQNSVYPSAQADPGGHPVIDWYGGVLQPATATPLAATADPSSVVRAMKLRRFNRASNNPLAFETSQFPHATPEDGSLIATPERSGRAPASEAGS